MIFTDKSKAITYLETLKGAIRVEPVARKRSLNSNNYYWLIMVIIGEHLGYYKNELHEVALDMFAPRKQVMDRFVIVRTSEMNSMQMSKYIDRIKMWALHELNITLPEADNSEELYRYYQLKGVL
jgi:hypothetical protein